MQWAPMAFCRAATRRFTASFNWAIVEVDFTAGRLYDREKLHLSRA
jgi:hypothetical protein